MTPKKFSISEADIYEKPLTHILERISKIKSLEELYMGFCNLSFMPEIISELSQIKSLSLRGNLFSEIPAAITRMKSLIYLDMGDNQITIINPEICQLKQLEVLDLSKNIINKIPDAISDLIYLKELYIHDNKITEVSPFLHKLINFKKLTIDHDIRIISNLELLPNSVNIDMSISKDKDNNDMLNY